MTEARFSVPHYVKRFIIICRMVVVYSLSYVQLLRPYGLQPARLLCPWDFPGKNTGVGCYFLLQEIFPSQESNPLLLHSRQVLYHLNHEGRPSKGQELHSMVALLVTLEVLAFPHVCQRGGRWEGCSGLGTHVRPWRIHVNVWQNQYSIVK